MQKKKKKKIFQDPPSKRYFYYFEAFRGTFITLEVYGYFGYFLALMVYFSHFGWSDYVNKVNQSFLVGGYNNTSIMQPNGDPKFDCWIGRMWWNICVCKLQWQLDDQIVRTGKSNSAKLRQSLLNLVNLWSNFKVGSSTSRFDQIR